MRGNPPQGLFTVCLCLGMLRGKFSPNAGDRGTVIVRKTIALWKNEYRKSKKGLIFNNELKAIFVRSHITDKKPAAPFEIFLTDNHIFFECVGVCPFAHI